MSCNRIQKLLFSEYSDFEDMVLVESPFAETTREGRGIRQVQIGLTPTKLVLATDIIKNASEYPVVFFPGCIDAEIECLELISIFPIELVTLSVFRRRRRKVLKAKFHDGNPNHNSKIVYFELGGSDKRKMFWNLWCERVKFLCPDDKGGSSMTETSVASSTSASSLYVAKTKISKDKIWQFYGRDSEKAISTKKSPMTPKWTDKDLFFGDKWEVIRYKIEPISYSSMLQNDNDDLKTLYRRQRFQLSQSSLSTKPSNDRGVHYSSKKVELINRFGEGIDEGCVTGLYLPAISYSKCSISIQSMDSLTFLPRLKYPPVDFKKLCEESVQVWEALSKKTKGNRHPRRYGILPMPGFCYGYGINFTGKGESFSVQVKKSSSVVHIHGEVRKEREFECPINRFHLATTISHESIRPWCIGTCVNRAPVRFWTTDCWYKPCTAKQVYTRKHNYLVKMRIYLRKKAGGCFCQKRKRFLGFGKKSSCKTNTMFHINEESIVDFKKKLKLDNIVSVWDIDSSALAFQITMIEAQLFSKIPVGELSILLRYKNARVAINFMNWLMFAFRVSCLVSTEVLRTENIKFRARLISRFINAAEKCHLLHNYQSCRSLLNGLQSPAIYRLKITWSQVRQSHATKYQMFEKLCRLYRDPRLLGYQKCFYKSSQGSPYLPSAVHILSILLGRVFVQPIGSWSAATSTQDCHDRLCGNLSLVEQCKANRKSSLPKIIKQIFSALKIYPTEKSTDQVDVDKSSSDSHQLFSQFDRHNPDEDVNEALRTLFKPVDTYDDVNLLEEAEELLKNSQAAARKYAIVENDNAKDFLLKVPYREAEDNLIASLRIEPD